MQTADFEQKYRDGVRKLAIYLEQQSPSRVYILGRSAKRLMADIVQELKNRDVQPPSTMYVNSKRVPLAYLDYVRNDDKQGPNPLILDDFANDGFKHRALAQLRIPIAYLATTDVLSDTYTIFPGDAELVGYLNRTRRTSIDLRD